jgi:DtxR family transcriptional regulator, Mn-dependent transcriptional regulator
MQKENFLTVSVENHLKAIYHLGNEYRGASTQNIAARLGISSPAVTKMLIHLAKHGLVEHIPYRPVCLTPAGEKIALELIRHHRLIELYLAEALGFGWEQVHDEAERLEHYISEEFESSIERLLGYPNYDPHGDPIPTRDGKMPETAKETMAAQKDGTRVIVRRVTDEDADLLRYLKERHLVPGTEALIVAREPFGGSLVLDVVGTEQRISCEAAKNIFVEPAVADGATA